MPTRNKDQSSDPAKPTPNIAYLFGAGATHAELANAGAVDVQDAASLEKNSLLLADVSKRVCRKALTTKTFPKSIRKFMSLKGLSNLELLISLLEKNQVESTEPAVRALKMQLKRDIVSRLAKYKDDFYLHKGLLDFHRRPARTENLVGLITLNYDSVLDEAYESVFGTRPNYCLSPVAGNAKGIPLLKLHGGFDLVYRNERLPIITPGVNKNYLDLPYNFVWGRALELLLDCDVLRVIGCSLSQNDIGIVDLLFKAHLKRKHKEPLVLQIIDFDPDNNRIKEHFGFFPRLERARD